MEFMELDKLTAGLDDIKASPKDTGAVEHIVCRPGVDQRQVLTEAQLDIELGLIGESWQARGDKHTSDGSANLDKQLNLMNSRVIGLIAGK